VGGTKPSPWFFCPKVTLGREGEHYIVRGTYLGYLFLCDARRGC
jgi:hypothetical protein